MIRRPPRSTLDRSSAASDVYKRQVGGLALHQAVDEELQQHPGRHGDEDVAKERRQQSVSYTHLRAHETVLDLVCRLLLEKKNKRQYNINVMLYKQTIRNTHMHKPPEIYAITPNTNENRYYT